MSAPHLKVIDTAQGIKELRKYLEDFEYVAYDCETTGLSKYDEIIGFSVCAEESKAFYVVLSYWDPALRQMIYIEGAKEASIPLINDLVKKPVIAHNATFDCMMAEAFFKIRLIDAIHTDTMILAHLLNENRRVGLKELGADMFGENATLEADEMKASVLANGGSLTKACYEMYKADYKLLGKYGAKDAWLTYKLFLELVPELYDQGLDKFFYEEESMPLLRGPTYELNTVGLQIDTAKLLQLKKTLEAECLEAKSYIMQETATLVADKYPGNTTKNRFNIGSSSQLSWLLFNVLGAEFGTLTKGGKEVCRDLGMRIPYTAAAKRDFIHTVTQSEGLKLVSGKKLKGAFSYIACDKRTLTKLAPKYQWVAKLLEYQKKTKLLSTYIKGIESRVKYGIIQSSFLQHGTTSGRYASRNPNFQNLPRDDKRIKSCVIARPGRVLVGADYSQLEPRVFAYFSGDKRLLSAFTGTDDFYSVIGMEVYNKSDCTPHKEGSPDAFGIKYKKLRDLSKVIALASTYGATAHQLAPTTGKSIEDTQMDMDNYFERFPGVADYMVGSHELVKKQGYVENLFGRKRRIPDAKKINKIYGNVAHADLPYDARNMLNLAVNHRIQSTGASIVNRAAIRFYNNCKIAGIDAKLVLQCHDSLIAECPEADAENVLALLQDAMENTVVLEGIRLEAIPKIGTNYSEV